MKVKSRSRKPVIVRGKEPEEVQDFKYQGSFISADSNIDREVSSRMNKIGSAGVQTAEQHLEVYNCPYQDNIQNLQVQCPFSPAVCRRDLENKQKIGE